MKFLVARRKTMHVFHASGRGFALNLLDPDNDPECDQPPFREVSSLRLPTNAENSFDLRASFQPVPQFPLPKLHGPALGNR